MTAWKTLDLRQRKTCGPHDGELIVLHMIPKSTWGTERYLVSRLQSGHQPHCLHQSQGFFTIISHMFSSRQLH